MHGLPDVPEMVPAPDPLTLDCDGECPTAPMDEAEYWQQQYLKAAQRASKVSGEYDYSSSDEEICHHRGRRKLRSGMLDKASKHVTKKETWPQKNLIDDLIDSELTFFKLGADELFAGEVRTIELCDSDVKRAARLRLLHHMIYLRIQGRSAEDVRRRA